jgi:RNA polymerase sigma-70 factor (ECF subfamily)
MSSSSVADFNTFYAVTFARTVACAYAVLGDLREAEDAAQDAYVQAWRRWSHLSTYDDPAAWVRRVATNRSISVWRRRGRSRRYLGSLRPPDPIAPPGPDSVLLVETLMTLAEDTRRALVLHYLGDVSVADIARRDHTPEGTIKARLARGRRALAKLLADTQDREAVHHDER